MTKIKVQTEQELLQALTAEHRKAMEAIDEFNKVMKDFIAFMGGREFI